MSEAIRKKVEEFTIKDLEIHGIGINFNNDDYKDLITVGADFVYPLALEEGFRMAIELLKKNLDSFGCLEVSGYETQIRRLQEEGQRLGILKEEKK